MTNDYQSTFMPSLHLYRVHKRFEGFRNKLDTDRREVFELAGRRRRHYSCTPIPSKLYLWISWSRWKCDHRSSKNQN